MNKPLIDPTMVAQMKNTINRFKQEEMKRLGIEIPERLENLGLAHMQFIDWWDTHYKERREKGTEEEKIMLAFINSIVQNLFYPGVAAWMGRNNRAGPEQDTLKLLKEYLALGEGYFMGIAKKVTDDKADDIKEMYRREQQMEWDMLSRSLEQAYEETRSLERKLLSQAERHEQHLKEQKQQYQMELERVRNSSKEKELQTALEKARLGQQMQLERHNAEVRELKAQIERLKRQDEPLFYTFETTNPSEVMSLAIFTNNKMPAKEGGKYTLTVQTADFKRWRAEVTDHKQHIQQKVSSKLGRAS